MMTIEDKSLPPVPTNSNIKVGTSGKFLLLAKLIAFTRTSSNSSTLET